MPVPGRMKTVIVEVQFASAANGLPSESDFMGWTQPLEQFCSEADEMVLRVVDLPEMIALNQTYRSKVGPTNVLSFPYEAVPGVDVPLLGDVVLCAPVVAQEAAEQGKSLSQHWAHLVIHGGLHLLGYDHIQAEEADEMEALEVQLLDQLGIPNPYQELEKS